MSENQVIRKTKMRCFILIFFGTAVALIIDKVQKAMNYIPHLDRWFGHDNANAILIIACMAVGLILYYQQTKDK